MTTKLTQGFITGLWQGERIKNPIVQVLNHKRHTLKQLLPRSDHFYQLIVWDGSLTTNAAVLVVRLNTLIDNGKLQRNSVIRLDKYACKTSLGKKLLQIYKLTILIEGNKVGKQIHGLAENVIMESVTSHHNANFAAPVASSTTGLGKNVAIPQGNIKIIPNQVFSSVLEAQNCMKPKLEDYSNNERKDGQELETIEFRVEENSVDMDTSSTLLDEEKNP